MGGEEVGCAGGGDRGGWRCAFLAAAYWEGTARLGPPTHAMTSLGVPRSERKQRVRMTRGSAAHEVSAQEPPLEATHLQPPRSPPHAHARALHAPETCARSGKSGRQSRTGEEEESREP